MIKRSTLFLIATAFSMGAFAEQDNLSKCQLINDAIKVNIRVIEAGGAVVFPDDEEVEYQNGDTFEIGRVKYFLHLQTGGPDSQKEFVITQRATKEDQYDKYYSLTSLKEIKESEGKLSFQMPLDTKLLCTIDVAGLEAE